MEYKAAVFIGRFQPFHNAHLDVLRHGLSIAEQVIVIVGSDRAAPNIRNPWSTNQRIGMIAACLTEQELNKVQFLTVRDYYYNDNFWVADIQSKVSEFIDDGDTVALLGNYKDATSYYFKLFPQWEFRPHKSTHTMDATEVRTRLFTGDVAGACALLPKAVEKWLKKYYIEDAGWKDGDGTGYQERIEEYKFIEEYKAQWKNAPFPPTFVTTDAVVIQSGHVLVVRRKFNPGKGLIALPGGFIREHEKIQAAAIRELKEETGIRIDSDELVKYIAESKVFDHPGRSLRGRTVTHAFYIKLKDGKLPAIKASDDAEKAFWMPLRDVTFKEDEFYEDHSQIIQYFMSRW